MCFTELFAGVITVTTRSKLKKSISVAGKKKKINKSAIIKTNDKRRLAVSIPT